MRYGQIAIVTGGASGIGQGLCEEIGRRDGVAIVTDINAEGAESVAAGIRARGGRAEALHLDVTVVDDVRRVVDYVREQYGRLDYYYNNAGIAMACETRDMTYERWQRIVDINLWGVIYGVQEAYRVMIEQGSGHIVNVASMAGIVGNVTAPAYTATKFAVVGLSNALRIEAASLGVNVSLVCPASVDTGIRDTTPFVNVDREAYLKVLEESRKMQWFAKMWDVETAARYILDEVAKNAFMILLPPAAKKIWRVARLFPNYVYKIQGKLLDRFRQFRIAEKVRPANVPG
jgi:NAD(P)-dependent dehydrogenase (short-subunit alcohol dehydrogenase family)